MTGPGRFVSASSLFVSVFGFGGCGAGAAGPAETPQATASRSEKNAPMVSEPARGGQPAQAASPASEAPQHWPFGPPQTPEERAAQLERLAKDPGPIRSNWVPPGKKERYGHAEGLIQAPAAVVKAKLEDFARYNELAGPKFKTVRVVDKHGAETDVYFQLPIMKGLITIQYITRFPLAKPAAGGGGDVVEGTFVKGNIKDMHIAFTVRPGPDDKSAVMVCDLVLLPNVPAPQSAIDEELRDACGDAVRAVRKTTAQPAP